MVSIELFASFNFLILSDDAVIFWIYEKHNSDNELIDLLGKLGIILLSIFNQRVYIIFDSYQSTKDLCDINQINQGGVVNFINMNIFSKSKFQNIFKKKIKLPKMIANKSTLVLINW